MDDCRAVVPDFFYSVIPAKAGIQKVAAKTAARNQALITAIASPLPTENPADPKFRQALSERKREP